MKKEILNLDGLLAVRACLLGGKHFARGLFKFKINV